MRICFTMSNLSLMNGGTSLNFDGQALQHKEEDEYRKEEEEQQKELQQLLTNAFDDLDDDDILTSDNESSLSTKSHEIRNRYDDEDDGEEGENVLLKTDEFDWGRYTFPGFTSTPINPQQRLMTTEPNAYQNVPEQHGQQNAHYNGIRHYGSADNLLELGNAARSNQNHFGSSEHLDSNPMQTAGAELPHHFHHHHLAMRHVGSAEHLDSNPMQHGSIEHLNHPNAMMIAGATDHMANHHFGSVEHLNHLHNHHTDANHIHHTYRHGNIMSPTAQLETEIPVKDNVDPMYRHAPQGNPFSPRSKMIGEREDAEGGNSSDQGFNSMDHFQQQQDPNQRPFGFYRDLYSNDESQPRTGAPPSYQTPVYTATQNAEPQYYNHNIVNSVEHEVPQNYATQMHGVEVQAKIHSLPSSPKKGENFDNYRVQYQRKREGNKKTEIENNKPSPEHKDKFQNDFMNQGGGSEEERQLAQLQILYKARGRKLDELTAELENVKKESAREIRMLKHKHSITSSDKEGAITSLQQCQDLLTQSKLQMATLENQLEVWRKENEALLKEKEEFSRKLQSAEITIENLNHQLDVLGNSESLTRARREHESVVSSLQQRHDKETLCLKEKIDSLNAAITEKDEIIYGLKQEVARNVKAAEDAHISRGETINRLTKSLEESQKQCQVLLETSSSQEMSKIKLQLQNTVGAKLMAEEMCESLKEEIKDYKEQLHIMESATNLGLFSGGLNTVKESHNDSISDLGIRKTLDFNTPDSNKRSETQGSVDALVANLRTELESCLVSNKQKRTKISALQSELQTLKSDLKDLQERYERSEKSASDYQNKLKEYESVLGSSNTSSIIEARLQKDIENLKREKEILLEDTEEFKKRIEELSLSEEKLKEMNSELSEQLSKTVKEFGEDKRLAVERNHRACQKVHETSKENLVKEMNEKFEKEKAELRTKYEADCSKLRTQLQTALDELDSVKKMYVAVCEEKDKLAVQFSRELNENTNIKIEEIKNGIVKQKDEEIEQLKTCVQQEKDTIRSEVRCEYEKDKEEEFKKRIELVLLTEKQKWGEEGNVKIKTEVERAEKNVKEEMETQYHKEVSKRVEEVKSRWMTEQRIATETELQDRLTIAEELWKESAAKQKKSDIDNAIIQAKQEWENSCDSVVENMKHSWEKQLSEKMETELQRKLKVEKEVLVIDMETKHKVEIEDKCKKVKDELEKSHEEKLKEVKQLLNAEVEKKVQEQLVEQVALEKKAWQSLAETERNIMLASAKEQWEAKQAEIVDGLKEAWKKEHDSKVQAEVVDRLVKEKWQKEQKELNLNKSQADMKILLEEMNALKIENQKLTSELESKTESWRKEKQLLLDERALERKKMKEELQKQAEEDYSQFLQNHSETLSKSLKEAREMSSVEVANIRKEFDIEVKELKAEKQKFIQILTAHGLHNSVDISHLSDKDDSVVKEQVQNEKEEWKNEKERLEACIRDKDLMMEKANQHFLHELSKLRNHMDAAYDGNLQKEKQHVVTKYEEEYGQLITDVQDKNFNLNHENELLKEKLENMETKSKDSAEYYQKEKQTLVDALVKIREQLKQSEASKNENSEAREKVAKYEQEIQKYKFEIESCNKQLNNCQEEISSFQTEKKVLIKNMQQLEFAYNQDMTMYRKHVEELQYKIQKYEKHLGQIDELRRSELEKYQQQFLQESSVAMEKVRNKMLEMKKSHSYSIEMVNKQHEEEKQELKEKLKMLTDRTDNSIPQKDLETVDAKLLGQLKQQYMETVSKVKADVMKHVRQTNHNATDTLKKEIKRERKISLENMRRIYSENVKKILQTEFKGSELNNKLVLIEQALDAVSMCSGSRSITPVSDISQESEITPRCDRGKTIDDDENDNDSISSISDDEDTLNSDDDMFSRDDNSDLMSRSAEGLLESKPTENFITLRQRSLSWDNTLCDNANDEELFALRPDTPSSILSDERGDVTLSARNSSVTSSQGLSQYSINSSVSQNSAFNKNTGFEIHSDTWSDEEVANAFKHPTPVSHYKSMDNLLRIEDSDNTEFASLPSKSKKKLPLSKPKSFTDLNDYYSQSKSMEMLDQVPSTKPKHVSFRKSPSKSPSNLRKTVSEMRLTEDEEDNPRRYMMKNKSELYLPLSSAVKSRLSSERRCSSAGDGRRRTEAWVAEERSVSQMSKPFPRETESTTSSRRSRNKSSNKSPRRMEDQRKSRTESLHLDLSSLNKSKTVLKLNSSFDEQQFGTPRKHSSKKSMNAKSPRHSSKPMQEYRSPSRECETSSSDDVINSRKSLPRSPRRPKSRRSNDTQKRDDSADSNQSYNSHHLSKRPTMGMKFNLNI